mgnify:CR=1 FL=1|tara:strand:+ start:206 stop:694 length:489 start_codon:yes stop_codon:yes gene_type:complete
MGDIVKKHFEGGWNEHIGSIGHFGNNAKQIIMSDREIMNAKRGKITPDLNSSPIEIFEHEYPDLSNEFIKIQAEMYEMFARKHMDYGLNNIALGGDIVNNSDDKQFSLTGLCIRLTDKISRLKNLLINGRSFVKGEGMEDTFIDIANYGIIGLLVGRDKWKK